MDSEDIDTNRKGGVIVRRLKGIGDFAFLEV